MGLCEPGLRRSGLECLSSCSLTSSAAALHSNFPTGNSNSVLPRVAQPLPPPSCTFSWDRVRKGPPFPRKIWSLRPLALDMEPCSEACRPLRYPPLIHLSALFQIAYFTFMSLWSLFRSLRLWLSPLRSSGRMPTHPFDQGSLAPAPMRLSYPRSRQLSRTTKPTFLRSANRSSTSDCASVERRLIKSVSQLATLYYVWFHIYP